jgi:hypothetical protein
VLDFAASALLSLIQRHPGTPCASDAARRRCVRRCSHDITPSHEQQRGRVCCGRCCMGAAADSRQARMRCYDMGLQHHKHAHAEQTKQRVREPARSEYTSDMWLVQCSCVHGTAACSSALCWNSEECTTAAAQCDCSCAACGKRTCGEAHSHSNVWHATEVRLVC